jgi:phospholipase C
MADNAMDRIKHLVVVMMENRSFDNLAGFLYAKEKNVPPANIPAPPPGRQPGYDGLSDPNPNSDFWNPSNLEYFTANAPAVKIFATQGTHG